MDNQTPNNPFRHHSELEVIKADHLFNQSLFRTISYTISGYGVGLLASVFFRRKLAIIHFGGGAGAGWGIQEFARTLAEYRRVTP